MSVVDIVIVIFLLFGAFLGFKRGFTKQLVSSIGFILVVILAFILKNPISEFLYQNLPFFKFGGIFKGVTVLNIVIYEVIAFLLVLSILMIGLRILLLATSIFEKVLNMTIILGIPSKIMGAILGVIEYYVVVFIILYILSFPMFNSVILADSKYKDKIIHNTPVLSNFADKSMNIVNDFVELKNKYEKETNPNQFNYEALDVLLKHKVISVKSVKKLDEKNKLLIDGVQELINKYEREG